MSLEDSLNLVNSVNYTWDVMESAKILPNVPQVPLIHSCQLHMVRAGRSLHDLLQLSRCTPCMEISNSCWYSYTRSGWFVWAGVESAQNILRAYRLVMFQLCAPLLVGRCCCCCCWVSVYSLSTVIHLVHVDTAAQVGCRMTSHRTCDVRDVITHASIGQNGYAPYTYVQSMKYMHTQ